MLLETLLDLLQGWAPAFRQRRTWARAVLLALGLLCGWGRRTISVNLSLFAGYLEAIRPGDSGVWRLYNTP